jgi:N-acyl-phosphatidylethanolamine-hydrolysing phospholipase D
VVIAARFLAMAALLVSCSVVACASGHPDCGAPPPRAIVDPCLESTEPAVPRRLENHVYANPRGCEATPPLSLAIVGFLVRDLLEELLPRNLDLPRVVANDGRRLREIDGSSAATVTWIGHATLLVQMGGVTFLTDPVWDERVPSARRLVEPGLAIDRLPPIDFIVVSHNHADHMDLEALKVLGTEHTPVIVPLGNAAAVREAGAKNVVELDWWQAFSTAGVTVHSVPTRHWSRSGVFDADEALWSGWYVVAPDRKFFFSGDSGLHPWFREIADRLGHPDLAALGIGAYEPRELLHRQHMAPEDAVEAAIALGARRSVGVHFGTFDLADENLGDPPCRFRKASRARGRTDDDDWILDIGETRDW